MDRNTAVTTWREVCKGDLLMGLPPTGRMLEEFARRIEAYEREACAAACEARAKYYADGDDDGADGRRARACHNCASVIRARGERHEERWLETDDVHPDDFIPAPADAERLAEALRPFAAMLKPHHERLKDDRPIFAIEGSQFTAGDLRRANAALAAHSAQAQPSAAQENK